MDMIPPAHRPTPRPRAHRILLGHRCYWSRRITSVRNKIRRILSDYNADREDLFTTMGLAYLAKVAVMEADRFVLDQLTEQWQQHRDRLEKIDAELQAFAANAPVAEGEARAVLDTIAGVGPVTVDVVISELGNIDRFRSAKKVCAYAGLAPGQRESAGPTKDLGITKQGSGLLRWVMVEAAWRVVYRTNRRKTIFEALAQRRGRKKAIVAVARRLLCVMVGMMRSGRAYQAPLVNQAVA